MYTTKCSLNVANIRQVNQKINQDDDGLSIGVILV